MTDSVEIERALEIQRAKLLRLLAGWLVIVEWMPFAPFVGDAPRWLRSFLGALVTRAEFAAQSLVIVSARLQAQNGRGILVMAQSRSFAFANVDASRFGDVPSSKALAHRMRALRALLEDLPRAGHRFLRRCEDRRTAQASDAARPFEREPFALSPERLLRAAPFERRIERPPDKSHPTVFTFGYLRPCSRRGGRRDRVRCLSVAA